MHLSLLFENSGLAETYAEILVPLIMFQSCFGLRIILIKESPKYPGWQDVDAVLYYGIVPSGAPLDQAALVMSSDVSSPRFDVYKPVNCKFEYGKNAQCSLSHDVDGTREFMLYAETIKGDLVPGSATYPKNIVIQSGKGQVDISEYYIDPEIFKKGESYRLVIEPSGPIHNNQYFAFPPTYVPFVAE
jgi:hypothetical protein